MLYNESEGDVVSSSLRDRYMKDLLSACKAHAYTIPITIDIISPNPPLNQTPPHRVSH